MFKDRSGSLSLVPSELSEIAQNIFQIINQSNQLNKYKNQSLTPSVEGDQLVSFLQLLVDLAEAAFDSHQVQGSPLCPALLHFVVTAIVVVARRAREATK